MFREPTLIVVGAGASHELNLPLGSGLMKDLKRSLSYVTGSHSINSFNIQQTIYRMTAKDANKRSSMIRSAALIAKGMEQARSIDNFLHSHQTNTELVEVGKIAIANCMLEAERKSRLFVDLSTYGPIDYYENVSKSYLHGLQQKLITGHTIDDLEKSVEHLTFVIFNYDRCLESFLPFAVDRFYNCGADRADQIVRKIRFIHPYGSLGSLERGTSEFTDFGADPSRTDLLQVSKRIRTFTEGVVNDKISSEIQEAISKSPSVIFLGFAFHDLNLQLFGISEALSRRTIVGTVYGISSPNTIAIETYIRQIFALKTSDSVQLRNLQCQHLIDEYDSVI